MDYEGRLLRLVFTFGYDFLESFYMILYPEAATGGVL